MSFENEVFQRVSLNKANKNLQKATQQFMSESLKASYSYNFSWMGIPIIQYPQDIIAIQEVIWKVQPDLIIETGIARGGSIVFYASLLELLGGNRKVIGVDIDIRDHARASIDSCKFRSRIETIQGSSIDSNIADKVKALSRGYKKVMVILDSNHTEDHVLKELNLYASLVSSGSYCLVLDSVVEHFPEETSVDRPWGKGNNPLTAVHKFLKNHPEFSVDEYYENKILLSVAPGGFLVKK